MKALGALVTGAVTLCAMAILDVPWTSATTDRNPLQPGPVSFPQVKEDKKTDVTFVGDPSTYESQCWFTDELWQSNGYMTVTIPIDRYVGDVTTLVNTGLIAEYAVLRASMFDSGEGGWAGEDSIYVNGHGLKRPATGANCAWVVHADTIPIAWLLFPNRGNNSAPTPKNNEIKIKVASHDIYAEWCTSVDWASLTISVVRPAIFVHGILSDHETWQPTWDPQLFNTYGVPFLNELDMTPMVAGLKLIDYIGENAKKIEPKVQKLKTETGSSKVNLIAHSKGGLDSRYYIGTRNMTNKKLDVDRLVQFGTPNAGSPLADMFARNADSLGVGIATLIKVWAPGGDQLTTSAAQQFNSTPESATDPRVRYTAIAGLYDPACVECPDGKFAAVVGPGDAIVPIWSVHSMGFPDQPILMSTWPDTNAKHTVHPQSTVLRDAYVYPRFWQEITHRALVEATENEAVVGLHGSVDEGDSTIGTIDLDDAVPTAIRLVYPSGNLDLVLRSPSGQLYRKSTVGGNHAFGWSDDPFFEHRIEMAAFTPTELGRWTVRVLGQNVVEPGNTVDFAVLGELEDPRTRLQMLVANQVLSVGDSMRIVGVLKRDGSPLTGARVKVVVVKPDLTTSSLILQDNGVAPDTTAGDGRYTGRFIGTSTAGAYKVACFGSGTVGGTWYSRNEQEIALVAASRTSYTAVTGVTPLDENANGLYDKLKVNVQLVRRQPLWHRSAPNLRDTDSIEGRQDAFLHSRGQSLVDAPSPA